MVAKLDITLSYEEDDSHDHLCNVRTFSRFEDRLLYLNKDLGEKGYLFIRFNANSIGFRVLPEGFEPMITEPLVECCFKLNEISEDARNYLKVLEDRGSQGLRADIQYDEARTKMHQILSTPIDERLANNQIEYLSKSKPTEFSRKLISAWFKQIALCESRGVFQPRQSIGSFCKFLHRQSLT